MQISLSTILYDSFNQPADSIPPNGSFSYSLWHKFWIFDQKYQDIYSDEYIIRTPNSHIRSNLQSFSVVSTFFSGQIKSRSFSNEAENNAYNYENIVEHK